MKLFELQRKLEFTLAPLTASPKSEARLLLAFVLDLNYSDLVLQRNTTISKQNHKKIADVLERRLRGEPLQHILGTAQFYGLELFITPDTLIPRPETEKLVELALQLDLEAPFILDVGTGSGAIALALKSERRNAQVWASDISGAALNVARENATRLHLSVKFVKADVLESPELKKLLPELSLIIANPPYLPAADEASLAPEVRREPRTALFAGEDGLAMFRKLESQAYQGLSAGAYLLTELDPRNVRVAAQLAARWQKREVVADLNDRERFLVLRR